MPRRLGLLAADEDPIAMTLEAFLEQGIAGYYDPKTKRHFYVIDGLSGEGQRPTILHELVHALEDQYFDLEKQVEPLEKDGDRHVRHEVRPRGRPRWRASSTSARTRRWPAWRRPSSARAPTTAPC